MRQRPQFFNGIGINVEDEWIEPRNISEATGHMDRIRMDIRWIEKQIAQYKAAMTFDPSTTQDEGWRLKAMAARGIKIALIRRYREWLRENDQRQTGEPGEKRTIVYDLVFLLRSIIKEEGLCLIDDDEQVLARAEDYLARRGLAVAG